jgi:voltage-gated potassium channel
VTPTTRADRVKRRFEWPLIAAAILVIPTIALDTSDAGSTWGSVASGLNWAIWTVFAAELFCMLVVVEDRWRYVREHPLDLAIVLLTPPFLASTLQAARVFRLLRLARLFKTVSVVRRLLSTEGVRDAAVLALLTILGGGTAFAAVEKSQHKSAWDGIWWAMETVTTVGYGDITPKTDSGRIIAITVMLVGIGFVALLTAAAAQRFIAGPTDEDDPEAARDAQLREINERLARLEQLLMERA